jgi:PAS domain S-box-containing protein
MVELMPSVLVVDDDRGLLRLIEKALIREGIRVAAAATGSEAADFLSARPVELLLLDLKLSDLQGRELVERLAAVRPSVPFIIMTGQGDERVAVEMMKSGAMDYLVKDAEFLELLPTRVNRALHQIEKDRKISRAEEALAKEHAFNAALLNTSGALIVALDRGGRIVRFNRACERTTGYSQLEVRGRHFWESLVPREEWDRVRASFEGLCQGQAQSEFEAHWLTKAGESRLIRWSNASLLNTEGEAEYIIGTGLDLTEHRRLEEQILHISELEKRNFGNDLHDGICQHLVGIELMSQVLQQNLERKSKTLASQVGQIAEHVREAISQARMLARGLSPVVLESEGLMSALKDLAAATERMFRIQCTFRCPHPVLVAHDTTAMHLYRIAQEAVSNAVKHGKATEIGISLTAGQGKITLEVRDNGVGFAVHSASPRGMGLHIMQYRAGIMGGSLAVQRVPEGGTLVLCVLPPQKEVPPSSL